MGRTKKAPSSARDEPVAADPAGPPLGERILAVAEALVAGQGLASVKVRAVAAGAGCSVGSVYNAYADIDDLIVAVNRRTLLRLDAWLERASRHTPEDRVLQTLAEDYLAFAVAETRALRALFEHRMADDRPFPDEHLRLVETTFSRLAAPIGRLVPDATDAAVAMLARTLFSAVHGIISLGLEDRLVAVPPADLEGQLVHFVDVFVAGLAVGRRMPRR